MTHLIKAIGSPKFTVLLHTYNRPAFLKQSTRALLEQTYDNLEIILINNGATAETRDLLFEFESQDKRIRLLHFDENEFRPWDPHRYIAVCYNSALEMSSGNYIWHQNDDDIIAADYIEKMVNLFQGNADCSSVAGLAVRMDVEGNILEDENQQRASNYRPRYMPGHLLALEVLRGSKVMYSSPGQIFSFKRDALLKFGGFHRAYENHHIYGIVPFSVTGFDETAYFYWRSHQGQLNKALSSQGWLGTKENFSMINDLGLENKWRIYGCDVARYVVNKIKDHQASMAADWFAQNFFSLRIKASLKILCDIWFLPKFWLFLPKAMLPPRSILIKLYLKSMPILRPILNCVDQNYPELKSKSTFFNKLIQHLQ